MLRLTEQQKQAFADAVAIARTRPQAIGAVYARFETERAHRQPRCDQSGRCCRFEAFGHRLFVTTLEMANFIEHTSGRLSKAGAGWDGTGCPFQVGGLCDVHPTRPFGCRAYFCDPTSTQWQNEQYERFHAEIRELHEQWGVPYLYVEWREALSALGVRPSPVRATTRSLPVLG